MLSKASSARVTESRSAYAQGWELAKTFYILIQNADSVRIALLPFGPPLFYRPLIGK